jgi:membrane-bound lytic murein transglycosylase B
MTRRRRFSALQSLAALTGLLLAVACAVAPPPRPTPPPAPVPAPPPLRPAAPAAVIPIAATPQPGPFQQFLDAMRTASRAQGITEQTFAAATAGLAPIPTVTEANENQPEFSRPVWAYLDSAVSARRVRDGQFLLARNRATLDAITADTGVPAEILVAIWGMETDYGRVLGSHNIFAALATLGYQGPRQDFGRSEFLAALRILQEQRFAVSEMRSSWAGAFGQTQFTPTTFLRDAADGDGDGRIDLWNSSADALASAANLLRKQGWKRGAPRFWEVTLPAKFAYEEADAESVKPLAEWRRRGVTTLAGNRLPDGDDAAIYLPAGAKGPAFLLFPNFNVLLKYNNAASYALAVSVLADRIAGRSGVRGEWPRDEKPLSRDDRINFQRALAAAGFDPGGADGVLGRRTRAATRAWQKAQGLVADGYPSLELLAVLQARTATR